jgi:hypothetical protein
LLSDDDKRSLLRVTGTVPLVGCSQSLYHDAASFERVTPFLRQTILLAVGTLSNKMINHMRKVNKPIPEFTNYIDEVSQVNSCIMCAVIANVYECLCMQMSEQFRLQRQQADNLISLKQAIYVPLIVLLQTLIAS